MPKVCTTHMQTRPDGVAVITLDNAPVNSLARDLVESLAENVRIFSTVFQYFVLRCRNLKCVC